MKSITQIFILVTIFTAFACSNNSDSQKTVSNEMTKAAAVEVNNAETAKAMTEKMDTAPKISAEAKEETAIVKDAMNTEAAKIEKKAPSDQKATSEKNVAKVKKQPTQSNNTASVKQPVEEPMEKQSKVEEAPKVEKPKTMVPDHAAWNTLLQKNVSATGKVNYKGFKAQQAELDKYLSELAANPPTSSWGRKEAMAYWINAYNANTVKLIVDNYPLSSITNLEGGKPWDKKWIKLGDKTYSLNNIENDILRPKYKDARIHFAVNCAAKSCPPILNKAWTPANLNANFEKQAKAFINNSAHNKISADAIEISQIFEWYAEDFDDIVTFFNKYSTTKINSGAKVSYKQYDWALNE